MISKLALLVRFLGPLALFSSLAMAGPTVRFLAESMPPDVGEVVMAAGEAVGQPFTPPTRYLSEPMEPPARAFAIRTANDKRLLANFTLPEEGDRFVILLLPDPNGGLQSIVLRSDQPGFRPGDNYLLNRTASGIVGQIGATRFRLKPGTGGFVKPSGASDEGFYQVAFGVEEGEGARALSTARWPVDNKVRSYVFFFDNPRTGRVDYRAVDEFVSDEKPE